MKKLFTFAALIVLAQPALASNPTTASTIANQAGITQTPSGSSGGSSSGGSSGAAPGTAIWQTYQNPSDRTNRGNTTPDPNLQNQLNNKSSQITGYNTDGSPIYKNTSTGGSSSGSDSAGFTDSERNPVHRKRVDLTGGGSGGDPNKTATTQQGGGNKMTQTWPNATGSSSSSSGGNSQTQQKLKDMFEQVKQNYEQHQGSGGSTGSKTTRDILDALKGLNNGDPTDQGNMPDGYQGQLFTYEDFLNMPIFVYIPTHQSADNWMYAPQGPNASRGGIEGFEGNPFISQFGWGSMWSLAGFQGSLGGFYPLLADLYSTGSEFNSDWAKLTKDINSRAGTGGGYQLAYVDPAIKLALAEGLTVNIVGFTGGPSTGGLSDVSLILPLLFNIFDNALEDGDNITLTIRDTQGVKFTDTFNLTNAGRNIAPAVLPGRIEIQVTANNVGSSSPNTGQIDILSTVTSGPTSQVFNLTTGQTGMMVITASP